MSETESTPRPRRSAREKRPSQQYSTDTSLSSPNKRKRLDLDTDVTHTDEEALSAVEELPDDVEDAEDDYRAPRKAPKTNGKSKAKTSRQPAQKKPRATKSAPKAPTRRYRKSGEVKATFANAESAEARISDDNALFNAIMNPSAALQSTVEDYLEAFAANPQICLADLINCVLRTCGSNDSVDSDNVVDYDGIVSALDDFTEVLKENEAPTYPLVSKHPMFKKFRKSLSEFLSRLVKSAAELGTLYTSDLVLTIQAWVVAMSSSQLRSFRHTATVIALEIETALCVVASAVEKEAEMITRQRDGERKRKARGVGTSREKDLEEKAADVKDRRSKLAEFLKDVFDSVFVHRYRDLDPSIRTECVTSIGKWLKEFPAHFLDGQYLRYIGWVLSDSNTHVRLEAVKSLVPLYEMDDFIVSLQSFTDRFKGRLVEMATGDTELPVRITVVQVLSSIDRHGLLEDDQRSTLCLLVFDAEAKVRRAVSDFVSGVWEEALGQRLVSKKKPSGAEKQRAGLKALAQLLVEWGRALDKRATENTENNADGDASSQGESSSSQREISAVLSSQQKGRIALAVEALWDEVSVISDWEAMLELLLLDHSAGLDYLSDGSPVSAARRKKSKKTLDDSLVDEAWRLEEIEEAILLEVLVAVLRKSEEASAVSKKPEEPIASEITRGLIKSLPGLIAKHQTDENRLANVLLIPELMSMDLYLEMRMMTAYESLWGDVTKQFMSHSSPQVLTNCVAAMRHFMSTTSLSNTNSTKILELEDELATSLRDVVAGRDELEVETFTDDEVLALGAICARLCALFGIRDLTTWMDEDEGGKQSSAWNIVCALAERGRLGYKEETMMVDRALHLLTVHVIWKARNLMQHVSASEENDIQESLREERDTLLEKHIEYALGTHSNSLLNIRRAAFQHLLTLNVLFSSPPDNENFPLSSLAISMDDEMQYRCAGFVQAEIDRYADELEAGRPEKRTENEADDDLDSDSDAGSGPAPQKSKWKKKTTQDSNGLQESRTKVQLASEYIFTSTMATFLRALRAGVIHIRHAAVLLSQYGRLGPSFDLSTKLMVDILREEGMYKDNGALVVEVVVQALKDAFTLVLDHVVDSEQNAMALAKALMPCLIVRGAQLSVVKRLPSQYVVEIHTTLTSWIMKRISAYETGKNKKMRTTAILFFRVLVQLLSLVEGRDALQIKMHLDLDISQLKLEIPPSSKSWEPLRAYEKRLGTAQTKEKGAKKGKSKAIQSAELVTTDDDDDDIQVEGLIEFHEAVSQPTGDATVAESAMPNSRPRPRPAFRTGAAEERVQEIQPSQDDDPIEDWRLSESLTPPPPETNGRDHSPVPSSQPSPMTNHEPEAAPQTKKRGRSVDSEQELLPDDLGSGVDPSAMMQSSEIIVRRKRVRH